MSERKPVETTNLDRYGSAPLSWTRSRDILAVGSLGPSVTFFLGTVRPDGRPHAAGVGAVWGPFGTALSLAGVSALQMVDAVAPRLGDTVLRSARPAASAASPSSSSPPPGRP